MEAEHKNATLALATDGPEGSFKATFATFNVIDLDGDVTRPGSFEQGKEILVSQYGHQWGSLPAGKATVFADDQKAWVEGQLFLDTTAGLDTYRTLKNVGALQEFSYGFQIVKASPGQFEGKSVRIIERVNPFEVSPVMRGAGISTGLQSIKGAMTLEDEAETALTGVESVIRRYKSLADLRAKEGRTLSAANRARISRQLESLAAMQEELSKLLADTEAVADPKAANALAEELLKFQLTTARLLGVR